MQEKEEGNESLAEGGEGRGSEPQRAMSLPVWDLLFALQKLCVHVVDNDGWWSLWRPSKGFAASG